MPLSAAGGGGSGAAGGEGGSSQQAGASEPGQAAAAAGSAAEAQLMPALPGRFVLGRLMRVCEERGVLAEGSTVYCILTEGGESRPRGGTVTRGTWIHVCGCRLSGGRAGELVRGRR